VRHQGVRRNGAELAGLEVLDRLDELGFRVHHERPVVEDGFADRLAAQQQNLQSGAVRVLFGGRCDIDAVAGAEHRQLTLLDRMADRAHGAAPRQHVDQRIEIAVPRQVQSRPGLNRAVRQRDRRVGGTRAALPVDAAGDDAHQRAAILGREQSDLVALDGLVARRGELILLGQIHPELDAVEHAAALDELGRRCLDVQDPRPGRHPLRRAVGDEAAATV
jgi:hypothetical protein